MTRILTVRGAGEDPGPNQMLGPVVRGMDSTSLQYPAQIRPIGTLSLAQSEQLGFAALRSYDALGGPWVGVGFSLGAYILGNFVMQEKPKNCKGIVLVADPLRARNQVSNGGVPANRFGLAGERLISGVPVKSFAIPDDPITSCPADNGLRTISDRVTGRRQPVPAGWWNAGATIDWALKYLVGGRHVAYGEKMPGSSKSYLTAAREAVEAML